MARHTSGEAGPAGSSANAHRHAARTQRPSRADKAQQRRLKERDQISGEIRTPAKITAHRARRTGGQSAEKGSNEVADTPVSARARVPERTFSGRIILFSIVTLVVISFLVPTVRTYLQQQAELDELTEEIAAEEQRQEEYYDEINRWDDPSFIRQQARERINLVMPGEKRYHIVGDLEEAEPADPVEEATEDSDDWTEDLWDSVVSSAGE